MRLLRTGLILLAALSLRAQAPPVLRHSPEFVLHFNDGSQTLLSSYKGKVVALLFVHTTCPHCQHTSQVFTQYYEEYGARGFQPLDVAFNAMAQMYVPDFIKNYGIRYPVAYSAQEQALDYMSIPVIQRYVVPQIIWIDRKGNIRSETPAMGDEELLKESYWRNMIETLLKEPAGGEPAKPHHTSAVKKTPAS
jgi:thiol-disulfide isomerase/thioredoxin